MRSTGSTSEANLQYLTFAIASEEYGAPLLRCREILEFDVLTKVPAAPTSVVGVMNLRGQVLAVVDLRILCGLEATVPTPRTCIVVVDVASPTGTSTLGLMVEGVNRILELDSSKIEAPPSFGTRLRAEYLSGMGNVDRKFVLLLDVDKMLSTEELLEATSLRPPPSDAADGDPRDESAWDARS